MAIAIPKISDRPLSIAAACGVFAYYFIFPLPTTVALFSNAESETGMAVSILVGLLLGLGCTILSWLRFSWARWPLAIVVFGAPIIDAYTVSILQGDASFYGTLLALLMNDWEYWLLLVSGALLFVPSSSKWFREKQGVAT